MRFQACTYKTTADAPRRHGIAKATAGFGTYAVAWIIDGETGEKVARKNIHNYDLMLLPLSYIDTEYVG